MSFAAAKRLRIYLRESERSGDEPVYDRMVELLRAYGIEDISVHRGIMGFDLASGLVSSRPLRFHADLPLVVEAVAAEETIRDALPEIKTLLPRGLITLSEVRLYEPTPSDERRSP